MNGFGRLSISQRCYIDTSQSLDTERHDCHTRLDISTEAGNAKIWLTGLRRESRPLTGGCARLLAETNQASVRPARRGMPNSHKIGSIPAGNCRRGFAHGK